MSKVVRGFGFTGWQVVFADPTGRPELEETLFQVSLHACGFYLDKRGHQAALNKLRDKVGVWIQTRLARRVLVPGQQLDLIKRLKEEHPHLRQFAIPGGGSPQHLADHLLLAVCEPLLRDQGLLVTRVDVRAGAQAQEGAELPEAVIARYLWESTQLDPEGFDRQAAQDRATGLPTQDPAGKGGAAGEVAPKEYQHVRCRTSPEPTSDRPAL